MGQLKQAGQLEGTIVNNLERIANTPGLRESLALHKNAKKMLKPHVKIPMEEFKVRELIHQTGIETFKRPEGIPENFLVRTSDRGAGMEYVHPTNTHITIRVMPGKLHSPHSYQQNPYIVQMKDGKAFDGLGNLVPHEAPQAHIPIDKFVYRE